MENILDIIYEYSKKFRLLDEDAINKIMDILIINNKLYNVEYDLVVEKNILLSHKELGYFLNDSICLYYNNLINRVKNEKHIIFEDELKLPLLQKVIRQNLEIAFTLMHETEHALQYKMLSEHNDNTLERRLLRAEDYYIKKATENIVFYDIYDKLLGLIPGYFEFFKSMSIYQRNYDISLMERLANLKTLDKIDDMLNKIKDDVPELYEIEKYILLIYQMQQYIENEQKREQYDYSPTIEFFNRLGTLDKLIEIDFINLPYEDRIKYGFYITDDEYNHNVKLLDKKLK